MRRQRETTLRALEKLPQARRRASRLYLSMGGKASIPACAGERNEARPVVSNSKFSVGSVEPAVCSWRSLDTRYAGLD